MKCSACEARLSAYLDNDCSPREAEAVAQHLASCAACRAQTERLRAVESQLARMRGIEPHADFTLAVMARVAAMPAPAKQGMRPWPLLVYVPAAWAALFALFATRVLSWQGLATGFSVFAGKLGVAGQALYHVGQHFNVASMVTSGAALEIALLALAIAVARIYIGHLPGWASGARA